MGSLRRQVVTTGLLCVVALAITAACSSDDGEDSADDVESPCRAFARNQTELLTTQPTPTRSVSSGVIVRIISSAGRGAFALANEQGIYSLYSLDDFEAPPISLSLLAPQEVIDVAMASEDQIYALVRKSGGGGGFDVVAIRNLRSPQPVTTNVFSSATTAGTAGAAIAVDRAGGLLIATPDVTPSEAQDPASKNGKVLLLSTPDKDPSMIDVVARGFRAPAFLSLDPDTDEIWLTDTITSAAGSLQYELNRVSFGKSYGWPILDGLRCADGSTTCAREGHVPPLVGQLTDPRAVFFRGADWPLSGQLLTNGGGSIGTIAPFGPSGPPLVSPTRYATDKQFDHLGVGRRGVYLASGSDVHLVSNGQPHPIPTALSITGCLPQTNGDGPQGAIAYDVASPLWSDGAEKKRFVVLPKGGQARVLDDGDIRFPVGTVAIKTFSVDGRKVETRLLIQHALEFWVGYSYRWLPDGSDAALVIGNRIEKLPSGKEWYFPSSTDCAACHTPAAGYTLGLESRQIASSAALDKRLLAPIDHAKFPVFAGGAAAPDQKARAYLHANCSICHREGSVTGVAELDLRFDTPLDKTGLCNPPKVDSLGLVGDARVVLPKKPEDSILVKRMRSIDPDIRMPKLATRVVDEAGALIVEEWIRNLASCP